MPRGGARQGTPGKAYSNRTDMMASTKPVAPGQINPTAAGGMTAPAPQGQPQPQPQRPMPSPDDSPMLSDPTQRPSEPITAGLPIGAGEGPSLPDMRAERRSLKRYLPLIDPYLNAEDTPDSVRILYNLIKGS